jgi:hypothetical protein
MLPRTYAQAGTRALNIRNEWPGSRAACVPRYNGQNRNSRSSRAANSSKKRRQQHQHRHQNTSALSRCRRPRQKHCTHRANALPDGWDECGLMPQRLAVHVVDGVNAGNTAVVMVCAGHVPRIVLAVLVVVDDIAGVRTRVERHVAAMIARPFARDRLRRRFALFNSARRPTQKLGRLGVEPLLTCVREGVRVSELVSKCQKLPVPAYRADA